MQETKLRGLLTGLTELRLAEPRTSDPAEYARLGLEDPTKDTKGTANLLRVLDGDGKPIVALIVGHRRTRTQGDVPEEVYVRRPDEAQCWLAACCCKFATREPGRGSVESARRALSCAVSLDH